MEILSIFNDKYAQNSPEMRLNNIIRVMFHINVFGRTDNMFGYRVMDYIYKYVKDAYICQCNVSAERVEKEKILFGYYCQYLFTCILYHYSEQSHKLSIRLLKDLLASAGVDGHITKHDMLEILLMQSAKYRDVNTEQIATIVFNYYNDITPKEEITITLERAREIIQNQSEEQLGGTVSRTELFDEVC